MASLPTESVLRAAGRWATLLRVSRFADALVLVRSTPGYADLPESQYHIALDWLVEQGFVVEHSGYRLAPDAARSTENQLREWILEHAIQTAVPSWLALFSDDAAPADDLPDDLVVAAEALELGPTDAWLAACRANGLVDTQNRKLVGAAGEKAIVSLLEDADLGIVDHVAAARDGVGYDVSVTTGDHEWHLEIKTTTKRARLAMFLSRNEWEVGRRDSQWRLVLVGLLGETSELAVIGNVARAEIEHLLPADRSGLARWESSRVTPTTEAISPGLGFLSPGARCPAAARKFIEAGTGIHGAPEHFAWFPRQKLASLEPPADSSTSAYEGRPLT